MNYDEFTAAWSHALRESGLRSMSSARESLTMRSLDRHYEIYVEPVGGQDAAPFHVTAALSWVWSALDTARMRSTEEDLLHEVLGDQASRVTDSDEAWLRIDVSLRASLPHGQPLPWPDAAAWASWRHESVTRLERIEPLVPSERVQETEDGRLAILAWQGEPSVRASCDLRGVLQLESVRIDAFQMIVLPRQWDDPARESDPPPDRALSAMFARVRSALHGWMEALDHLSPPKRPR